MPSDVGTTMRMSPTRLADGAATQGSLLYRDHGAEERVERELGDARLALRRVFAIEHTRHLAQPKDAPLPTYAGIRREELKDPGGSQARPLEWRGGRTDPQG